MVNPFAVLSQVKNSRKFVQAEGCLNCVAEPAPNLVVLGGWVSIREVGPSPATHAILTQLKAGECVRHSIQTQKVS